jgi:hypothetical protein
MSTAPGKLRGGRVVAGVHLRRARWRPYRRASLGVDGLPAARRIRAAFSVNPRQDDTTPAAWCNR